MSVTQLFPATKKFTSLLAHSDTFKHTLRVCRKSVCNGPPGPLYPLGRLGTVPRAYEGLKTDRRPTHAFPSLLKMLYSHYTYFHCYFPLQSVHCVPFDHRTLSDFCNNFSSATENPSLGAPSPIGSLAPLFLKCP
jgi:hypothetical protein